MKRSFTLLLSVPLLFLASCNSTGNSKDSNEVAEEKNEKKFDNEKAEDDLEFLVKAASGGLMEVQLGQLAQQNALSPKIKEFGMNMVTDHSKVNDALKELAAKKNISIPATPGDKHKKHVDELAEKKGADFDKAYIKLMVEDHEEDISKFEKEAQSGNDAEIKAFAAGKLGALQHHLDMCKTIRDTMKDK